MTLPEPYYHDESNGITIYVGDNRDVLPHIEPVHAVVTDPPYGLEFMGKGWDHSVPGVEFWQAISAAMLPGAHLLAFGGTRTYHRMAVAIEDAGYEIRDTLQWLYGSGFPKSHDVSKAIDKMAGAEREVVGEGSRDTLNAMGDGLKNRCRTCGKPFFSGNPCICPKAQPATPEAEQWQGWGTALKPAYEPIIMARLPFKGTVAANVLAHGTGAINVDACRIAHGNDVDMTAVQRQQDGTDRGFRFAKSKVGTDVPMYKPGGRWPSNVILDEAAAEGHEWSRFFYVAKASRAERNRGLDGMPEKTAPVYNERPSGGMNAHLHGNDGKPAQNHHPTVKPLALMRYLIQMVTPPDGVILDPFAGSGSTLVAAAELGFHAIGIELSEEYAEIAARRVDHALNERARRLPGLEVGT